jgi:tetratricopeptide (TPR) repeat protein
MTRLIQRAAHALAALLLLWASVVAARGFYSQFFTVEAQTAGSREQHQRALLRALEFDLEYNWANLLMARLMLRYEAFGGALEYQEAAMQSHRTVGAVEQMGSIQKRLGNTGAARTQFQKAVRINPGNVRALTQLALLAYDAGDLAELEQLTAEILRHDLGNLDAHYLRALAADREGNTAAAVLAYQRVSAGLLRGEDAGRGTLFTKEAVEKRLRELAKAGTGS